MTFIYRNNHTGQVEELPARSARLDALGNWQLIGGPNPDEELEAGPVDGVTVTLADPAAQRLVLVRPPDSAPKPAWVAYAVANGMAEADARALSKASLIEEFGKEDDSGEN